MSEPATENFDVIVVGAGPAGTVAALELARGGCGPVLLVDKAKWPRTKPCGGGLSPRALHLLDELGLGGAVRRRAYPIRGLRLVSPDGNDAVVYGPESAAIMNRREFDQLLVDAAVDAGVHFRAETEVTGLAMKAGRVAGVHCRGRSITAPWVLVANGAHSNLGRDPRPRHALQTCMAWFDNVPFEANRIEMIYDLGSLPHYGWLFPEPGERVNIGLCLERETLKGRSIRGLFESFLKRYFSRRLARAVQVGGFHGHPISTTARVEHHAALGSLLIGEANRLTNIATGEGIVYALESGQLAARAICWGREQGIGVGEVTRRYAGKLRRSMEMRFRLASLFCRVVPRLLNTVTALGNNPIVNRLAGGAFSGI